MNEKRKLAEFIIYLQSRGKYSFTFAEAEEFTHKTISGVRQELDRLNRKGMLVTVRKGFYCIVPPEYRQIGLMPPELFIHPLMKWLDKPYYIGLLSAAALYGSAHQQPQEFFVVTTAPAMRSIEKKGYKINFIVKKSWQDKFISEVKTDTGFVKVSSPELTVIDLVGYYKNIGGLTRATEVIKDLIPLINQRKFKALLQSDLAVATIQRTGYILDLLNCSEKLTEAVREVLKKKVTYWIPLVPVYNRKTMNKINKWKIDENLKLELEL
jgi:predicted transcriptional regulator of viral defense system